MTGKLFVLRKKNLLFSFLIINLVLSLGIRHFKFGTNGFNRDNTYSIEIAWHGMESTFMEHNVAVPLEKYLFKMNGLIDVNSIITDDLVKVYLSCDSKSDNKAIYAEIQEALSRLYEKLPLSVQKPVISRNGMHDSPVFYMCLACDNDVSTLRNFAEHELKPKFESIKGVSQVKISGGMQKYINVKIDSDKISKFGINPQIIASVIQDANGKFSSLSFNDGQIMKQVNVDSCMHDYHGIKDLCIATQPGSIPFSQVLNVLEDELEKKEIVRINGHETVGMGIMCSSEGNAVQISRECKKILRNLNVSSEHCIVLIDEGKTQMKIIKKVFAEMILSLILVSITIPMFFSSKKVIFYIDCFMVVNVVWTFLILSIFGFSIDKNIIAGIAISLGLVADPFFIVAEVCENASNEIAFFDRLADVIPALLLSLFTTLIVLVPIYFSDSIVPGISVLSVSISISLIVSYVLALIFFPPLIFSRNHTGRKRFFLFSKIRIGMKQRRLALCLFSTLSVISCFSVFFMDKNLEVSENSDVIYGTVEYDSDVRCDVIDEDLKLFCAEIINNDYVDYCRVESTRGRAELAIKLNNVKKRNDLIKTIFNSSEQPEGFLYFDDSVNVKNGKKLTMTICGDQHELCRQLAMSMSSSFMGLKHVKSSVLNFKGKGKYIQIKPIRDMLCRVGMSSLDFCQAMFWQNGTPVIDKWIENGIEKDVRINNSNAIIKNLNSIRDLNIPFSDGTIKPQFVSQVIEKDRIGRITRKDCRPCASFSVELDTNSLSRSIEMVEKQLSSIALPDGYVCILDKDAENLAENYIQLGGVVFISVALIFFLMNAMTENFKKTFLMLSIIPVSIFLPLIMKLLCGNPLVMGDMLGIALSAGLTVNIAIAIIWQKRKGISECYENKMKSIFATSLTTIAGAIPVLVSGNKGFVYDLSFFMLFSTAGSLIAIIKFFPALLAGKNETSVHEVSL